MSSTEQARIIYDSARSHAAMEWKSGLGVERTLVFRAGAITVDLIAHVGDEDLRLFHGQVILEEGEAPVSGAIVRIDDSPDLLETDRNGRFVVSTMATGEDQILEVETGNGRVVLTIPANLGHEER